MLNISFVFPCQNVPFLIKASLSILHNLAKALSKVGFQMITILFVSLTQNVAFLIKASLSILHNLAKAPSNRHYYRQEQVEAKIQPFAQGSGNSDDSSDDDDSAAYLKAIPAHPGN